MSNNCIRKRAGPKAALLTSARLGPPIWQAKMNDFALILCGIQLAGGVHGDYTKQQWITSLLLSYGGRKVPDVGQWLAMRSATNESQRDRLTS